MIECGVVELIQHWHERTAYKPMQESENKINMEKDATCGLEKKIRHLYSEHKFIFDVMLI